MEEAWASITAIPTGTGCRILNPISGYSRILSNCRAASSSILSPVGPLWPGCIDALDDRSRRWYADHEPVLVAWSPGGNGYFADGAGPAAASLEGFDGPVNRERRARVAELAARRGATMSQVALAWVLGQPFAPVALVGTTSVAHLEEALGATTLALTEAERRWLEWGDLP